MMVALDQNDFSYKIKYIKFVSHVWRSHFPRFHEYQELMRGFKNSQDVEIFSEQMMQFLEGYPDLIEEFNRFLPSRYKINTSPPMSPAPPVEILSGKRKQRDDDDEDSVLQKAIGFVNKVKERLPPNKFESFLDIFCSFFRRHKSSSSPDKSNTSDDEVQTLKKVAALLPEDLTQEFTQFLSEVPLFYFLYYYLFYKHKSLSSPDKSNTSGDEVQTFKKVAELLPEDLTQFLSVVSPLSSTTDLSEFETCTPSYPSMTDLSEFETCTPSYRLLPEDIPIPAATGRRKEDSEVLNDRCLCPTAAGGAKEIQPGYEKNQFMCEDERYEYDMTMSNLKSTSKGLKQVWKEMETDGKIRIKDHLSERNLRCIEILYGSQGLEVRDCLMTNTLMALPVILNRLRQKKQELKAIWDELNQSWAQLRPVFKH